MISLFLDNLVYRHRRLSLKLQNVAVSLREEVHFTGGGYTDQQILTDFLLLLTGFIRAYISADMPVNHSKQICSYMNCVCTKGFPDISLA